MTRPPGKDEPTPLIPGGSGGALADLLVVVGQGRMSSHALDRDLVIGRGDGCDVVIADGSLSRRHAVIHRGPPVTVQDLGSTNGTRVGDQLHRGGGPVAITAGGAFHIGPFTFLVSTGSQDGLRSASGHDLLRVADPTVDGVSALVRDVAASGASVLILGETGVGKEVLAATLHQLSGRDGPLTRINCASLSENLLESELFGHVKGAFTGASANKEGILEATRGGTVFLDEVGELPPGIQAKLLRAVEQREILRLGATRPVPIDVRFVSATNRDLPAEVAAGRFRRDLFFRLDGVTLSIPPLRERRGSIAVLAGRFLDEACRQAGRPPTRLGEPVIAALQAHDWPGNVRELKAVIERAILLARGGELGVRHLAFTRTGETPTERPAAPPARPGPGATDDPPPAAAADPALAGLDAEQLADRARLIAVLEECAGNQTRAARQLGISRTTLVNRLRLYRIPRPRG